MGLFKIIEGCDPENIDVVNITPSTLVPTLAFHSLQRSVSVVIRRALVWCVCVWERTMLVFSGMEYCHDPLERGPRN